MAAYAPSRRSTDADIDQSSHRSTADRGTGSWPPLVDTIKGSMLPNLKELRPGSVGPSEVRLLFVFDPERQAVILVGGDKAGNWRGWYRTAIPLAEAAYAEHIKRMKT